MHHHHHHRCCRNRCRRCHHHHDGSGDNDDDDNNDNTRSWLIPVLTGFNLNIPFNMREYFQLTNFFLSCIFAFPM